MADDDQLQVPAAPKRIPGFPENFDLTVFDGFKGLNTKPTRPGIEDQEMSWCDNWMPLGENNLRTMYDLDPFPFTIQAQTSGGGGGGVIVPTLLYVAGSSCEVSAFNLTDTGNVAPHLDIQGNLTGLTGPLGDDNSLTYDAVLDSSKNIFALITYEGAGGLFDPGVKIVGYAPGTTGNVAPTISIFGSNTNLPDSFAAIANEAGFCIDGTDRLYAGYLHQIIRFDAGANGNAVGTIIKDDTTLGQITGMRFDAARQWIWLTTIKDGVNGAIAVWAFDLSMVQQRKITGASTGLTHPNGIGISQIDGRIYVVDEVHQNINIFASAADGNVAPTAQITGASTGLSEPTGITLDTSDNIYICDRIDNSTGNINCFLASWPAGTTGNVAPSTKVQGNLTGLFLMNSGAQTSPLHVFVG